LRHRKLTSSRKPESIAAFEQEVFDWPVKEVGQDEPPFNVDDNEGGEEPAEGAKEEVGDRVEEEQGDIDLEEQGGRGDRHDGEHGATGEEGNWGEKASAAVTSSGRVTGKDLKIEN
jgi:hypothetical protein